MEITGKGLSATTGDSTHPRLALGPSGPLVAWVHADGSRRDTYVRRWTGSTWEELGGSASGKGLSTRDVTTVALAADPRGRPLVLWGEGDEDTQDIVLRAWSGSAWGGAAGLGGGSISAPSTFSVLPAIASSPTQTCAAWALYNGDRVVARCAPP